MLFRSAEPTPIPEYGDRGDIACLDPGFFARMGEAEFAERFGDTPLERPGLEGMRRNWAAAFRSLQPPATCDLLPAPCHPHPQ